MCWTQPFIESKKQWQAICSRLALLEYSEGTVEKYRWVKKILQRSQAVKFKCTALWQSAWIKGWRQYLDKQPKPFLQVLYCIPSLRSITVEGADWNKIALSCLTAPKTGLWDYFTQPLQHYWTGFKNLRPRELNWLHFFVANIQEYDLLQLCFATWILILVYSKDRTFGKNDLHLRVVDPKLVSLLLIK